MAELAVVDNDVVDETSCSAWLLQLGEHCQVCIGLNELRHLITDPQCHRLPKAPDHCQYLVEWEEQLLPLYDLNSRIQAANGGVLGGFSLENLDGSILAVIGYQRTPTRVDHGVLALIKPPELIEVVNQDFIEPDKSLCADIAIINSCIEYKKQPVPVINLKTIFSA